MRCIGLNKRYVSLIECDNMFLYVFIFTGLTALHEKENNFNLMYEQIKALKEGKTVKKPIYNHVNG